MDLIIIGHGPSVDHVHHDFIDKHTVCRLRRAIRVAGTRTDIICSVRPYYKQWPKAEWWSLAPDAHWRDFCIERLAPYRPKFIKPSTGLSACMIAKEKGYKDIRVIGFDWVINPETGKNITKHDAHAEHRCFMDMDIKYEQVF